MREALTTRYLLGAALLLFPPGSAAGRTWLVKPDGSGDAPTIQAGINVASSGDSIVVTAGAYSENLDMRAKTLVLRGKSGADSTTVDGGHRDRVLAMTAGTVEGLTLQAGFCFECDGAGVRVTGSGPTTIRNCIIQDNAAGTAPETGDAGGLYFFASHVLLESCVIRDNSAGGPGGGLYDRGALNIVRNNIFSGNRAIYGGGGMVIVSTTVTGNLIIGNESDIGAGGIESSGLPQILNNTVVGNRTTGSVAGIGAFQGVISHNIVVQNGPGAGVGWSIGTYPDCNDIWGNETDVIGWSGTGNGNFSQDPLFCDPLNQNYSLASQSPCLPEHNSCATLIGARSACPVSDAGDTWDAAMALTITPNPPASKAIIHYRIGPSAGSARLTVFDLRGRVVARIMEAGHAARQGEVNWDGRDGAGNGVGAGVYIVRLETDKTTISRKVVWVR